MNAPDPTSQPATPLPPPLPPPLPYEARAASGQVYESAPSPIDVSRAFPVQAAKFSVYSALFAFLSNYFAVQGGQGMPAAGHLAITVLCGILIASGFILGIVALVKNRHARLPGVRGYALTGIAINGFFLVANIVLLTRPFAS